jgi:hypothetical protein
MIRYSLVMWKAVILLWGLNLFDAVATCYATGCGYGVEANPLMAGALDRGPWSFVIMKTLLLTMGCLLLMVTHLQSPRFSFGAVIALNVLYAVLACWHVYGFLFWR